MSLVEINVLGVFNIKSGERTLGDAAKEKARALLTYLALEGAQPRNSLTALLWPYLPQDTAFANLRKTLHRLRQRLNEQMPGADAFLIISQQNIQLDPQQIVVDVLRLQSLLVECERHAHETLASCDACLNCLAQAVGLYRGELLAGFEQGDAPGFEEWLLLRRETLQQQVLLALTQLSAAWEARGDFGRANTYASRIVAIDPLREEGQRQQMRLLVRLNQRNKALQQYTSYRRLLHDTLGVEPEPATIELYEQLRHGQIRHEDLSSPPIAPQPTLPQGLAAPILATAPKSAQASKNSLEWGEVPEMGRVYGREAELAQLKGWLRVERCQVVAILGIGGMGKTTLTAAVASVLASDFDKVIWRSLLNAPPVDELLRGVLQSLAPPYLAGLPVSLDEQLALLLNEVRRQRCLLVLDNLESILQPDRIGQMRAGYEGYAQLLRCLAENRHKSSLLLTSRERPQGLARWEEDLPWVRSLQLEGLDSRGGRAILTARGLGDQGTNGDALVQLYSGHPLALKLVTETIQDLFAGDIAAFLASEVVIFDDIRAILDQQFERLSLLEQELLIWFAVEREPVSLEILRANSFPMRSMQEVTLALQSLQRRSLVQRVNRSRTVDPLVYAKESARDARFAASNVAMEYLIERLVTVSCREIEQEQPLWLHKYALLQAQAQEYIRQTQIRLVLQPIASRLEALLSHKEIGKKVLRILQALRSEPNPPRGYAVGNFLNLLSFLEINVGALDLAGLSVWQADLRQVNLAGSNLAGADLTGSRFADAFGLIRTVAVSPDGMLIAGGTSDGEIRLWDAATGRLLQVYQGHKGPVRSIAFHPDGTVLASGSEDQTIRFWGVANVHQSTTEIGPFAQVLAGHNGRVTSVVFHPDGKTLVSGSADGTVRLWEVASGGTRAVLHGHENWVSVVAMSPDGHTIASGGSDRIILLWDFQTADVRVTLTGHKDLISSLAFDPSGTRLASGSYDQSVRLWELASGHPIYSLEAATDLITCVAFSPNGELLVTGGDDSVLRAWDTRTGTLTSVFYGHTDAVCGVAFSPDGQTLVSGAADQQICLWDVQTTHIRRLFSGYSQAINSIAFHPSGKMLASGHFDYNVRLWQLDKHEVCQILQGHTRKVNCVAFSADGSLLASGSDDSNIQVWAISEQGDARRRNVLRGHPKHVVALDFHPDGKTLLSGSEDPTIGFWRLEDGQLLRLLPMNDMPIRTVQVDATEKLLASDSYSSIRLWDAQSGLPYATLKGHANFIWSLSISPDSHWLASGGSDGTIGLWDVRDPVNSHLVRTIPGHTDRIFMVAFHPNGRLLASGSADQTVRVWDMQTHEVVHTFVGHTHWVWALAFSPDGKRLASGGYDETVRLWDVQSGESLGVYHTPSPFANMNISEIKGISHVERTTLKLLGAIEQ